MYPLSRLQREKERKILQSSISTTNRAHHTKGQVEPADLSLLRLYRPRTMHGMPEDKVGEPTQYLQPPSATKKSTACQKDKVGEPTQCLPASAGHKEKHGMPRDRVGEPTQYLRPPPPQTKDSTSQDKANQPTQCLPAATAVQIWILRKRDHQKILSKV